MTEQTEALTDAPDEWELPDPEAREAGDFRLLHERMLAWAMRKARDIQARRDDHARTAAAEIARIEQWHERVDSGLERDGDYFEALIVDYARWVRSVTPRIKSVSSPYGTAKTKELKGRFEVDDADALLAWAREVKPDLVTTKTTESVKVNDLKAVVTVSPDGVTVKGTGEFVPGVKPVADDLSVTVKIDAGAGVSDDDDR